MVGYRCPQGYNEKFVAIGTESPNLIKLINTCLVKYLACESNVTNFNSVTPIKQSLLASISNFNF